LGKLGQAVKKTRPGKVTPNCLRRGAAEKKKKNREKKLIITNPKKEQPTPPNPSLRLKEKQDWEGRFEKRKRAKKM